MSSLGFPFFCFMYVITNQITEKLTVECEKIQKTTRMPLQEKSKIEWVKQNGSTHTHHRCEGTEVEQGPFRVDYSTHTILWYTVTRVVSDFFHYLAFGSWQRLSFCSLSVGVGKSVIRGAVVIFSIPVCNESCVRKEWRIGDQRAGQGGRQRVFACERVTHIVGGWPVLLVSTKGLKRLFYSRVCSALWLAQ